MINIFLFLSIAFLFTFLVGRVIEKIHVPWIFASLLLGFIFAIFNPFPSVTTSSTFNFLAELGMYFLLFIIGFEMNINKLKKASKFILKGTFIIIPLEALFGTLLVHFVFGYGWFISFAVALSFATVGEAILVPILDEFGIINTKLGQSIIGIGAIDDIIEVYVLILIIFLIGSPLHTHTNIVLTLVSLFVMFILTFGLTKLKEEGKRFCFVNIEILFLLTLFILFLFIGVGEYSHAAPIAALLAGISLKTFIPERRLTLIESEIKTMCYGFFAPIFFLWVGSSIDVGYIAAYPLLVLLVVVVSSGAKIIGSYLVGKKELGRREALLLGIGLSARFSTSAIIIKLLFENKLIDVGLYSVIVTSTVIFTFFVPILFSTLLAKKKKQVGKK